MRTYAVLAGDGIGLVLVETLEVEEEERDNFVASTMEEVVLDRLLVGIVNGPLAITKQVSAVGVLLHIHLEAQASWVRRPYHLKWVRQKERLHTLAKNVAAMFGR